MSQSAENSQQHELAFSGKGSLPEEKVTRALAVALDVRKFEIDLYWKRASYFWVFTGAALAGYLAASAVVTKSYRAEAMLLTSCVGLVFAFAWYLVNRASKFWQSNWEAHVDLLEDKVHGPLYKTVLSDTNAFWTVNAAYPFSISRLNQVLSFYVFLVFLLLAANTASCSYRFSASAELSPTGCLMLTVASIVLLPILSKSGEGDRGVQRRLRRTHVKE